MDRWRPRARAAIRAYPRLVQKERMLHTPSVVPTPTGMPRGNQVSDPTAETAMRELPRDEQRQLDAVIRAIETTRRQHDRAEAEHRLTLIDIIYWRTGHNLHSVETRLPISYATAKDWHNDFLKLVDAFLGESKKV